MGNCTKALVKVKPVNEAEDSNAQLAQMSRLNKKMTKTLALKDTKGFKRSDHIEKYYKIIDSIGRGSFGEVIKAVHLVTNEVRAIKVIEKKKIEIHDTLMKLQRSEFVVLQETDHPNLMRVYELMEDESYYYIISELLEGGELYDRIIKYSRFSEKDCAYVVHQLLLGLNYMHKKNIIHRDIKPENVLMESSDPNNLRVKITDFGFARFYDPHQGGLQETLGSPLYMAPEIVKNIKYNTKVDVWSLGVMAYIMLSGKPPFKGKTKEDIYMQLQSQAIEYTDSIWSRVSKEGKSFVKKCLTKDPKHRATADELLQHDWIKKYIDSPKIEESELLEISENLQNFRRNTVFQTGVMGLILSFHDKCAELDELKNVFLSLDKSNDGMLTVDEINSGLAKVMGIVKGSQKLYEELLKDLDKDGNGVIDYSEFLTAAVNRTKLLTDRNMKNAFAMIDTDKSGTITIEELRQAFETHSQKDFRIWTNIMQQVDKNNDGKITFDEFTTAMTKVVSGKFGTLTKAVTLFKKRLSLKSQKSQTSVISQQGS